MTPDSDSLVSSTRSKYLLLWVNSTPPDFAVVVTVHEGDWLIVGIKLINLCSSRASEKTLSLTVPVKGSDSRSE